MNDFTEIKSVYRVRIDKLDSELSWLSNKTFDNYQEAWNYAKQESPKFGNCGFCVVCCDEPQITLQFQGVTL